MGFFRDTIPYTEQWKVRGLVDSFVKFKFEKDSPVCCPFTGTMYDIDDLHWADIDLLAAHFATEWLCRHYGENHKNISIRKRRFEMFCISAGRFGGYSHSIAALAALNAFPKNKLYMGELHDFVYKLLQKNATFRTIYPKGPHDFVVSNVCDLGEDMAWLREKGGEESKIWAECPAVKFYLEYVPDWDYSDE